jgi:hypothetical protein
VLLSRRIASAPEPFRRVFGELEPWSLSVVFEATYGWHWFADLLADAGIEAHMAHPLATKAISAGQVKNDSVDARTLAHLLRTQLLPEAWIAPTQVRERRRLARTRTSLVRIRSRLRCQVHAILVDHCVQLPLESIFGPAGRRFLTSVELPAMDRGRVDAALRLVDAVTLEVIGLDKELRAAFTADERIRRLMAIPGHRLPHRGGGARRGGRRHALRLRRSARELGRAHPDRALEEAIARRRGAKIARVALARRLFTKRRSAGSRTGREAASTITQRSQREPCLENVATPGVLVARPS